MKIHDIEFKPITIVLGVFNTKTFSYFRAQDDEIVHTYSSFLNWYRADKWKTIEVVENACNKADMIIFILDDVHFPIDPSKSITCRELELICQNDVFFNKTTFVKGENVIDFDRNLVFQDI